VLPSIGLPSGSSRVNIPPTIPAASLTPSTSLIRSSVSSAIVPLPSPITIKSVSPQALSITSSNVARIVQAGQNRPQRPRPQLAQRQG
jgi:hypothetical protein